MRRRWTAVLLSLLLLAGCAAPCIDPPGSAAVSPLSRQLSETFWGRSSAVFQGRFGVVLERGDSVFSMQGVLRVDTGRGSARVVALSDLGMRLFDIELTAAKTEVHSSLPHLGLRGVRQRVATAVRRMLLAYLPGPRDRVTVAEQVRLTRCADAVCLHNIFDAPNGPLRTREYGADRLLWRAAYGDFRTFGAWRVPSRCRYTDDDQGYVLVLQWNPERKD